MDDMRRGCGWRAGGRDIGGVAACIDGLTCLLERMRVEDSDATEVGKVFGVDGGLC